MNNISDNATAMEVSPVTILPHEIIEQLAELDLELSEGKSLEFDCKMIKKVLTEYKYQTLKIKFTSIIFSGDITQKGYEKKRRKLLLPFMTQQNESNGHPSQPSPLASSGTNNAAKNLDASVNDDPSNASVCSDAEKGAPTQEAEIILSPNGSKDNSERAPSYIPVSTNISSSQNLPISSAVTDVQQEPSTSVNEGASIEANSSDQQGNESREEESTVPPAIPPHKVSPNESSNVCSSDNTSVSTPIESTNVTKISDQTAPSNENGAIPKPKPNKPRSRNRHKRYNLSYYILLCLIIYLQSNLK